jgi:ketosteroid isomerase-like protein
MLSQAYELAVQAHSEQLEDFSGQPYILHPIEVARLLFAAGYDDEVVAAGLLHDTVERSELTVDDIRGRFGDRVAGLVQAVTQPPVEGPFEDRKAALREQVAAAGADADALFAADKIAKSASLRSAIAQLGSDEVARRVDNPLELKLDHYQASLDLLERVAADIPFLPRLHAELDGIEEARSHDEHFELARRAIDAVNRRDPDALIEMCSDDVEWWPAVTLGTDGEPYRGAAGIRAYIADLDRAWSQFTIELEDLRATHDRLMAVCGLTGRGRRDALKLQRRAVVVYQVASGRITGARTLLSR